MFENCKVSLAVSKCPIETFLFNFVKFRSSSFPQTEMKAAKQSDFLDKRRYSFRNCQSVAYFERIFIFLLISYENFTMDNYG